MNVILIKAAMETHVALETRLVAYEKASGENVYDLTHGQGGIERSGIIVEAISDAGDAILSLCGSASVTEVVYGVGDTLAALMWEQFDQTGNWDADVLAKALRRACESGLVVLN